MNEELLRCSVCGEMIQPVEGKRYRATCTLHVLGHGYENFKHFMNPDSPFYHEDPEPEREK
jgi:hypothetical protein